MRQRFRERALEDERAPEVVPCVRVIGLRAHRPPVFGDGGVEVARGLEGRAQVVVHGGAVRPGAQGLAILLDGLRGAAARLQGRPEVRVGHEIAGILLQPAPHERFLQGPAVLAPRRHELHPRCPISSVERLPETTRLGGWLGLRTFSSELS